MPNDRKWFPVACGIEEHFAWLQGVRLQVYLVVLKETNYSGRWVGWTTEEIAERVRHSVKSVQRALRELSQVSRTRPRRRYIEVDFGTGRKPNVIRLRKHLRADPSDPEGVLLDDRGKVVTGNEFTGVEGHTGSQGSKWATSVENGPESGNATDRQSLVNDPSGNATDRHSTHRRSTPLPANRQRRLALADPLGKNPCNAPLTIPLKKTQRDQKEESIGNAVPKLGKRGGSGRHARASLSPISDGPDRTRTDNTDELREQALAALRAIVEGEKVKR
jgi:hypothetical protein